MEIDAGHVVGAVFPLISIDKWIAFGIRVQCMLTDGNHGKMGQLNKVLQT